MGKTSRVYVYGFKGVGKTAILEQAIYGKLTKDTFLQSTIEDIYPAVLETERGTRERVRFYDTAGGRGPERPSVNPADGYLLVFNPSRMDTLDWVVEVKKEIDRVREKKEVVVVVFANHTSPLPEAVVTSKASGWSVRERLRIFDVSALERSSLYDGMAHLATRLAPPPTKSAFPVQFPGSRKKTSTAD